MGPPSFDHGGRERDSYVPDRRDRRDRHDRDRGGDRDDRESGFGGERGERQSFAPANELQFATPQDAEAAFMKVLKQLKVQPDWDWTTTIRAGIKDPNWRAIIDPEKREEAFKKYCEDLRIQEKNKEQDRQAKLRSDFSAMLRSHPEIKHYTKWKTARPILEEETIFRSAKDDTERRQLFDEYISQLKRSNTEKEAGDKKSALDGLEELLHGLDLEPFTRWHTAEEKLELTREFNSEKYQPLHRIDVLSTFEKHIRQLQREHNDQVQAKNSANQRVERQNRDAFKKLLTELQENGTLRNGTKWKDIHGTIKDDSRYTAMLGQGGSSPLDMFWDVVEIEEQKFRTLRRHALNALEVSYAILIFRLPS
jgi:pre-mRNA-processing factor 40